MLNWGDREAAERLAAQLRELLKDRTMTYDQLASCYSIRHGQSVTQRLKDMSRDRRPMSLGDFIVQMAEFFQVIGANQVCARGGAAGGAAGADPGRGAGGRGAAGPGAAPGRGAGGPGAVPGRAATGASANAVPAPPAPPAAMKYAEVSRGVQNILKEHQEPITVAELDELFGRRFSTSVSDVVGMSTAEYLQRKENIFDFQPDRGTVFLQSTVLTGPPVADPGAVKDEAFVVREFEQLIETMGPVVYISTLCGKFIQRNGVSVTSIINTRPLDLFKRHPSVFLIVGAGNVTLQRYQQLPDVQRIVDKPSSKAHRIAKAAEEAQLPVPEVVAEQHVMEEFRRLILADATDSVYISSLCGRFLQRFKKPVTSIISCKPAEFVRRYPDVFVMTGGGNVGLREVLGPDAVSVPPPPPRVPKALREEQMLNSEAVRLTELTDQAYADVYAHLDKERQALTCQTIVERLQAVCQAIQQTSFLALEEVALGGAAPKGLLTSGPAAEIVLFVRQLPFRNFPQWLPHILETLAPVLQYQLSSQRAVKFKTEKDHLRFVLEGGGNGNSDIPVQVYLSPVFKNREHLLESIKASPPGDRQYFFPACVKERTDFVARQPQQVKVVIRLMTFWAAKQTWTSSFVAPSDWLVELAVVHALRAEAGGPRGLAEAVSRVLQSFANFEASKVVWKDRDGAMYSAQDVWKPLLSHEPLFMDPTNPYCSVADANSFDARELAAAAQPPACLLAFKREVVRWRLALAQGAGEEDCEVDVGEEDEDCEVDVGEEDEDVYEDAEEEAEG